jgi:hypothetical protein
LTDVARQDNKDNKGSLHSFYRDREEKKIEKGDDTNLASGACGSETRGAKRAGGGCGCGCGGGI